MYLIQIISLSLRDISQDIILEFINNENKRINKIMENKKGIKIKFNKHNKYGSEPCCCEKDI